LILVECGDKGGGCSMDLASTVSSWTFIDGEQSGKH
jgi:hypothetical protein